MLGFLVLVRRVTSPKTEEGPSLALPDPSRAAEECSQAKARLGRAEGGRKSSREKRSSHG